MSFSMTKSCENCLYNKLCCPERMTICTDFEDKRRYVKFTYSIGDTAYFILAGAVHEVTVKYSSWIDSEFGKSHYVTFVVDRQEITEAIEGKFANSRLFKTREEAEETLNKMKLGNKE